MFRGSRCKMKFDMVIELYLPVQSCVVSLDVREYDMQA